MTRRPFTRTTMTDRDVIARTLLGEGTHESYASLFHAKADRILAALADAEIWVGIAPITKEAATRPAKPRRPMSELGFVMQARILCNDPQFQTFCGFDNELATASYVRARCGIGSRVELATDKVGQTRWNQLRTEFDAATGKIGHPDNRGPAQFRSPTDQERRDRIERDYEQAGPDEEA